MLLSASLIVKNYRGFSDASPLKIEINEGFTSFIGRNNAGKSSILKFFYEFRQLWKQLARDHGHSGAFQEGGIFHIEHQRNIDPHALFFSGNERDLEIYIELKDIELREERNFSDVKCVSGIRLSFSRLNPSSASFAYYDSLGVKIEVGDRVQMRTHSNGRAMLSVSAAYVVNLEAIKAFTSVLSNALYIGPFRNAINQGEGEYYDLKVGSSFITQWNNWKNGGARVQNHAISQVAKDIRNIFEFSSLDINASADAKTFKINANDNPYEMDDLGAGLAEFIIVLGNAAINKPSVILIDEPELHLHPILQIDFLTSLAKYASYGVMFASHSLGLARAVSDQIYSCQLKDDHSVTSKFDSTPNYIEFLGEMSFSAYKAMGYESILLVEGVTDVKVVQQFLRKLKKDHKVVILPLGGNQLAKGGVEEELAEFTRLSDNIYALVDSEKPLEGAEAKQERRAFKKTGEALGFKVHLTEFRATENYFTDRAVKEEKTESFTALEPYQLLNDCEKPWSKKDNWRIASRMSKQEIMDTDIGRFLSSIN